jgi:hypothetical protein
LGRLAANCRGPRDRPTPSALIVLQGGSSMVQLRQCRLSKASFETPKELLWLQLSAQP